MSTFNLAGSFVIFAKLQFWPGAALLSALPGYSPNNSKISSGGTELKSLGFMVEMMVRRPNQISG
jgi:hypothetical protein